MVALVFIPKIKEIICNKNEFIKKYIILIRIILIVLAIFAFATLTNQFEGTWINDSGDTIILDSTYIKYKDSQNVEQEASYSYESIINSEYDCLYEINGTYKNEKVILRYYKKNSSESLCIYINNECVETFKRAT